MWYNTEVTVEYTNMERYQRVVRTNTMFGIISKWVNMTNQFPKVSKPEFGDIFDKMKQVVFNATNIANNM